MRNSIIYKVILFKRCYDFFVWEYKEVKRGDFDVYNVKI